MKKNILAAALLGLAMTFMVASPTQAQSQSDIVSNQAKEIANQRNDRAHEVQKKSLKKAEEALPASGEIPCENGQNLTYTFSNGVLTIDGTGDKVKDFKTFQGNTEIKKVTFASTCSITSIPRLFEGCASLTTVENMPDTIVDLSDTFNRCSSIKELPTLPANLRNMSYAFAYAQISSVDFSKIPASVSNLSGAFAGNPIVTATVTISATQTGSIDYAYCLSRNEELTSVVVDASNLNDTASLWLQGIVGYCPNLTSFKLINTPATNQNPGSESCSEMFRNCEKLETVSIDGYFNFSIDRIFYECKNLTSIESKGFARLNSKDCIRDAFLNCEKLTGDYYLAFATDSDIYDAKGNFTNIEDKINYSFGGCGAANFYLGSEDLVKYLNARKSEGDLKTNANLFYWAAGDYKPADQPVVVTPPANTDKTPSINTDKTPSIGTDKTPSTDGGVEPVKKVISTFKLTGYKKNAKKITGMTIKKAKVVIAIGSKKYTVKANSKGSFTVKLKKKLKKNNKIKVTITKSGYKTKTKTFKVK